jgi:hypothetical protein
MSFTSSENVEHVAVRLSIADLDFGVTLGFADAGSYEIAQQYIFGRLSGARLPPLTHELAAPTDQASLFIEIDPRDDGRLDVQFRGRIDSPRYVAEREGFHWDFSKVLNALVMAESLRSGLVPLHGACVATPRGPVLLLGASGAGKSSTSYAALAAGKTVYATELGFVRGDVLTCANSALTMDRGAIDRFGLSDELVRDAGPGPKFQIDLPRQEPVRIAEVCFVQVNDGAARSRPITDRRARMLIFENVVTQLPVTQLLAQETWPLWMPPTKREVNAAMHTVQQLSVLSPRIVEGHPTRILELVCDGAARA